MYSVYLLLISANLFLATISLPAPRPQSQPAPGIEETAQRVHLKVASVPALTAATRTPKDHYSRTRAFPVGSAKNANPASTSTSDQGDLSLELLQENVNKVSISVEAHKKDEGRQRKSRMQRDIFMLPNFPRLSTSSTDSANPVQKPTSKARLPDRVLFKCVKRCTKCPYRSAKKCYTTFSKSFQKLLPNITFMKRLFTCIERNCPSLH